MSHCGRFQSQALSRRDMLRSCACGFGAAAFAAMFADVARAAEALGGAGGASGAGGTGAAGGIAGSGAAAAGPHFAPTARSVIFLYMDGGPSQMDTFDPKPVLRDLDGKPFPMAMERTQFNDNGATLGSPWEFARHGQCGLEVSSLFPHVARCADDLCVVRSMTSRFNEHTNANYFLHTGAGIVGRPSMGAWVSYGLGDARNDLPNFVVLNGGLIPPGGRELLGSGFLPASYQSSVFRPAGDGMANVRPAVEGARQRRTLDFAASLDAGFAARTGNPDALEGAIRNAELAFAMQASVPDLMAIDGEPAEVRELYGLDAAFEPTRTFARECLLARRMVERGVRFVELTCPSIGGNDRWDQHSNLRKGHEENARAVDQPIAALLIDLKRRGLLGQTLVVWGGEFGRTPFAQGKDGRDHNPHGFTVWLAGGGIRGGMTFGATDEFGYKAVDRPVEIHDLHATMLHCLGFDHRLLTARYGGRDMRLTDVHGRVMREWLA
jgi:hypothetical protein